MKKILTLLTVLSLCFFVAACSDDDESYNPSQPCVPGTPGNPDASEGVVVVLADPSEGSHTAYADQTFPGSFTFNSKSAWTATIYEGLMTVTTADGAFVVLPDAGDSRASGVSWVRLLNNNTGKEAYAGKAGNFTLKIQLDNNYTGETREATVVLGGGTNMLPIHITQQAVKADGELPEPEWSWEMAADSCTYVLINQFFNVADGFFWASAGNASGNSQYHYWQNAHSMDVMIYSYERIKDSDPELAATYREYMEKWFQARGHNYAGPGFKNNYTDDMAWMVLTLMHMSEATGETKYYDEAKKTYDQYMLESDRIIEDADGWGLIWTLEEGGKGGRNACTNTPAGIIACKLYLKTGNPDYLDQATKIYDYMWKSGKINTAGRMEEPPLTYTQGTWMEMCRLLYQITRDSKYMKDAETCIKFTMTAGGRCCNANGILRDEGTSEDQSLFKAVCIPYMVNMAHDSRVSIDTRKVIKTFLLNNAQSCWFQSMNRSLPLEQMYANYNWISYFEGGVGSHGCQTSAASLLEGVTRLPKDL